MKHSRSIGLIEVIVAGPSVLIGTGAMIRYGVSSSVYMQNLLIFLICWTLSCYVIHKRLHLPDQGLRGILILVLILYIFTLIDSGTGGVHRWISVGPVGLHISSICLPVLMISLWEQLEQRRNMLVYSVFIAVSVILTLQPDASQITAFGIPMMVLLYAKLKKAISVGITVGVSALITFSWINLDTLPPVEYVEEIFGLVSDIGVVWTIVGVLSLVLLPMPFMIFPKGGYHLLSRCVGLYFIITICVTWFGNFPMPMMGYGISPIIGYFIAITWLVHGKKRQVSQMRA